MTIQVRAVWGPESGSPESLAPKLIDLAQGMAQSNINLSKWLYKETDATVQDAKPLLWNLTLLEAEEALTKGAKGSISLKGVERQFGYRIAGWSGTEECGAEFNLAIGIGDVGPPAPNSFTLKLFGSMTHCDVRKLFSCVIGALHADAGDVTTDEFLREMLSEGSTIIPPSGGTMAFIRNGDEADFDLVFEHTAEGTYLHSSGAEIQSVSSLDFEKAHRLHTLLAPWRLNPITPPNPVLNP